jgi:plastocyanin
VALAGLATPALAQTTTGPHLITIKLVERPGDKLPFAFEPATFTAQRGDTLKFVQYANTIHNVHFKKMPSGAKLGSAATSPYLSTKGQAITMVVDGRFVPGSYEIVCDPHEMIGMHAFLTVDAAPAVASKQ